MDSIAGVGNVSAASLPLALLLLVLFPFLWLVQMSFRPNDDIFGYELAFTPTLDHYRALWTGTFPGSFVNSVVVSLSSTALALLLGVFIGPSQAASRTLMARLAPPGEVAAHFGLFALSGRVTGFLGPAALAAVTAATGSQRAGMATVVVFLGVGAVLLAGVREPARG